MSARLNQKRQLSQVESKPTAHLYPKRRRYTLEGFTYTVTPKNLKILKIFNFEDFPDVLKISKRKGSAEDVSKLEKVFSKMEYKVENFQNLTREETMEELNKIREMELLDITDQLILAVLSHGDEKDGDSFLTSDGKSINMAEIWNMFSNSNCPKLMGKPKIFICNFCRDISRVTQKFPEHPAISTSNNECSPSPIASFNESKSRKSKDEIDDAIEFLNSYGGFPTPLFNDSEEKDAVAECIDYVNHSKQTKLPSLLEEEGKHITKGVKMMVLSTDGLGVPSHPFANYADDLEDMATIYSCEKGFSSYRNEREGSAMIQSLCRVLEELGQNHDLSIIFCCLQKEMKMRKMYNSVPSAEPFSPELKTKELKTFKF